MRWAKGKGWDVTAEVTPHHLLLTDELAATLRPDVQGQPAAAHGGRRRRAARRAGGRHDRLRGHRPRPARPGGQGDRVGRRAARHDGPGDRARRSSPRRWSSRAGSPGARSPTACRDPARIGRLEGHGRPLAVGEPANLVPGRRRRPLGRRPGPDGQPQPQHAVRRPRAAGAGGRHVPAGRPDGAGAARVTGPS